MDTPRPLHLLLLALLDERPLHGYALRQELNRRSGGAFELLPGTMYPLLRRLEIAGLVVSGWQEGPRRRRRVYELTEAGGRELDRRLLEWADFVGAMTAVIGG